MEMEVCPEKIVITFPEANLNRTCNIRTKMFAAVRTSKINCEYYTICSEIFQLFPNTDIYRNTEALKIITKYNELPFIVSPIEIHAKMRLLHFDKMQNMFREIVTAKPMVHIHWLKAPMFGEAEINIEADKLQKLLNANRTPYT